MKKYVVISVFIILSGSIKAQTEPYQPYILDSITQTFTINSFENICYKRHGDTTINDSTYLKCYRFDNNSTPHFDYIGGLRQEIQNEKLFFIDLTNIEYDVSINQHLNINDTLILTPKHFQAFCGFDVILQPDTTIIISVDSVFSFSGHYREYRFQSISQAYNIGGSFVLGLTFSDLTGFEFGISLLCYNIKENRILGAPPEIPCYCSLTEGIEENVDIGQVSFHPNPVKENLFIEVDYSLTDKTFILTDCVGNLIFKQKTQDDNTSINFETLSKGLYFLKIENDKTTNVFKIIKN